MADFNITGHCGCGSLNYHLIAPPLFVHACHCLQCKRKSCSSFKLTCIIIESEIKAEGDLNEVKVSPRSTNHCCYNCAEPIYTTSSAFPGTALLQTNTLKDLRHLEIGAHIWVKRKDSWLFLPQELPLFEEGYERESVWPAGSLNRLAAILKTKSNATRDSI